MPVSPCDELNNQNTPAICTRRGSFLVEGRVEPRSTLSLVPPWIFARSEVFSRGRALRGSFGLRPQGPPGRKLEFQRVEAFPLSTKLATVGKLVDLLAAYGAYPPGLAHAERRLKTLGAEEMACVAVRGEHDNRAWGWQVLPQ